MRSLLLFSSILLCGAVHAQNVGIGNTTPHTKLEVTGAISSTPASAPAGANVNIPDNVSIFRLTAVLGNHPNILIVAHPQEGQYLTIYNEDGNTASFGGFTVTASGGVITLEYINGGWRLVGDNAAGNTGATGPTGTQGVQGMTGPTGAAGSQGATGTAGTNGTNGATGPTGAAGSNGTNGTNGTTGPSGPQGVTGPAGTNGTNGTNGATGPTGAAGANGTNGTNGTTGPTGLQGAQGVTGTAGTNGTNGSTGPTGAAGANGTNGTNGTIGPTGLQGAQGVTGTAGTNGTNGTNGATGPAGPTGTAGTNGTNGAAGANGTNGATGATGATGAANALGTVNYVAKFTAATTLGNSEIFDNGSAVGIGNLAPVCQLDVATSTAGISAISGVNNATVSGTSWNPGDNYDGVSGQGAPGSVQYGAGVYGYQIGGGLNSGGVVGAFTSTLWGGLGYTDGSGNIWGVYCAGNMHVAGHAQIVDGTQGLNKVLTSDAAGNGSWQTLSSLVATGWGVTGNTGTNSNINFIGTADTANLRFKVNNITAGYLDRLNYNAAMGVNALSANSGLRNSAMGYGALAGNTTGSNNTANGANALFSNTTGISNIGIGIDALYSNVSGSNLVAVGDSALFSQNGGAGANTAIGSKTLFSNTTGQGNTAIGSNALFTNTNGWNNTAIGQVALYSNSIGNGNCAVGEYALESNSSGNSNIAVGASALGNNRLGSSNSALGIQALGTNQTGSSNTALGFYADVTVDGLTNAAAIGANAKVSSSNAMVLGGTGGNAVNVGIGTQAPNPSAVLDLTSTSQGFLQPRMSSAQMNAIPSPADGLTVYNTDLQCLELAIGGSWEIVACRCPAIGAVDTVRGPRGGCPGSTVTYSIVPPLGASTYTWSVTETYSPSIIPVTITGTNPISFQVPAASYSDYQVNVTVSNACGTSSVIAPHEIATIFTAATTINSLYNTSVQGSSFTANWNPADVAGAQFIFLEVAYDAGFSNLVYGYPYTLGFVDSFHVTGLAYNTTYYWRVAAGSFACGFYSTAYSAAGPSVLTLNHGSVTYNTPNSTHGGTANVFTVPAGITSLTVQMAGGNGGNLGPNYIDAASNYYSSNIYYFQGFGDIIDATLAVTPGQQLWVSTGANGTDASDGLTGTTAGGYGGISGDESGGNGGAGTEVTISSGVYEAGQGSGGGGASDIRTTGGVRLIVAGGGGGAGYYACSTSSSAPYQGYGGFSDAYGVYYNVNGGGVYGSTNLGGTAGTNGAGGSGLTITASAGPLCSASLGSANGGTAGGNGGTIHTNCSSTCYTLGGGGGGGGMHGGGGGDGGGGGGGASYTGGAGVSNVTFQDSFLGSGYPTNTSGGYVTLTW